ncbi:DUF1799 domain-containing protein [Undibacterium sp. Ji22W]|uniref:DUF1799 domain-containing protein n=1 Tax=Undibacterium sp. Ji22W TaxID=3413038 RepID=UPI003BF33870
MLNVNPSELGDWLDEEDDDEPEPIQLHRNNVAAINVFIATWTQWRAVARGDSFVFLGIDYAALSEVWQRLSIPEKERNSIFEQLQQIERKILPIRNGKS